MVTSGINRDVLLNHPWVDRVFTYDKRAPLGPLRLVGEVRRARFDLAIALHTMSFSFTTLMLTVLSGAPVRIGSTRRDLGDSLTGSYLNLTLPLPGETELATMNEAEHNSLSAARGGNRHRRPCRRSWFRARPAWRGPRGLPPKRGGGHVAPGGAPRRGQGGEHLAAVELRRSGQQAGADHTT